jgi:hypothetical protein
MRLEVDTYPTVLVAETRLWVGRPGFNFRRGERWHFFLFATASGQALGPTQLHIQWVPGAITMEVKRPGRDADHSPQSGANDKKCVELYIHPRYVLTVRCLIKQCIHVHGVVLSLAQGQLYLYLCPTLFSYTFT